MAEHRRTPPVTAHEKPVVYLPTPYLGPYPCRHCGVPMDTRELRWICPYCKGGNEIFMRVANE